MPDGGRAYLSKFLNDNYMIEYGFLEREAPAPTVDEVLLAKHGGEVPELVTIESHHKVGEAISLMQRYSISQLPVVRTQPAESLSDVVGSLQRARPARPRVQEPRRPERRGRRRRCSRRWRRSTRPTRSTACSRICPAGARRSSSPRGGPPAGMLTRSDLLEYLARARNGS